MELVTQKGNVISVTYYCNHPALKLYIRINTTCRQDIFSM